MVLSSNHLDFPIVVVGFEAVKTTNSKTNMHTVASGLAPCQLGDPQVAQLLCVQHPLLPDIGNS